MLATEPTAKPPSRRRWGAGGDVATQEGSATDGHPLPWFRGCFAEPYDCLRPAGVSRNHDTHRLHAMAPGLVGQTIEPAAGHARPSNRKVSCPTGLTDHSWPVLRRSPPSSPQGFGNVLDCRAHGLGEHATGIATYSRVVCSVGTLSSAMVRACGELVESGVRGRGRTRIDPCSAVAAQQGSGCLTSANPRGAVPRYLSVLGAIHCCGVARRAAWRSSTGPAGTRRASGWSAC
jgi:hypothetical protein